MLADVLRRLTHVVQLHLVADVLRLEEDGAAAAAARARTVLRSENNNMQHE